MGRMGSVGESREQPTALFRSLRFLFRSSSRYRDRPGRKEVKRWKRVREREAGETGKDDEIYGRPDSGEE